MHSQQSPLTWSGREDPGRGPRALRPLPFDPLVELLLNEGAGSGGCQRKNRSQIPQAGKGRP